MCFEDKMENNIHNTLSFLQVRYSGADKGYAEGYRLREEDRKDMLPAPSQDDEEYLLWGAFKNGSEVAFTHIYNQYIFSMFNYGEWITTDKELIEDSIHDLFVDLWRNRKSIGHAHSIRFYLYKALKRKIIKNLTLKKRLPLDDSCDAHDIQMTFSHEFELITQEVSEEQKMLLAKALNSLTKRQKKAVILRFYDGLSYVEIAELLSISVKSTYTLLYRAIDVLRGSYEKIFYK